MTEHPTQALKTPAQTSFTPAQALGEGGGGYFLRKRNFFPGHVKFSAYAKTSSAAVKDASAGVKDVSADAKDVIADAKTAPTSEKTTHDKRFLPKKRFPAKKFNSEL